MSKKQRNEEGATVGLEVNDGKETNEEVGMMEEEKKNAGGEGYEGEDREEEPTNPTPNLEGLRQSTGNSEDIAEWADTDTDSSSTNPSSGRVAKEKGSTVVNMSQIRAAVNGLVPMESVLLSKATKGRKTGGGPRK